MLWPRAVCFKMGGVDSGFKAFIVGLWDFPPPTSSSLLLVLVNSNSRDSCHKHVDGTFDRDNAG